ncbi:hypothetical protein CAEBREN_14086 [Caenorhabditis brenneri]|uniref:DUF7809 domain-containing protein n=1 Tax=Caenorhabditis brenneri TaxID=135651 RepID=G0NEH2_CAEBE|nr:hypothetical protein CAEBREN_14086 [Caenorhabditis brenneri]
MPAQQAKMENYKNDPEIYTSLKNVNYIYKMRLLLTMYHLAMQHISSFKSPFAQDILGFYIKNLQSHAKNQSELIELPTEFFVEVTESMRELDREAYITDDDDEITLFEVCIRMLKGFH